VNRFGGICGQVDMCGCSVSVPHLAHPPPPWPPSQVAKSPSSPPLGSTSSPETPSSTRPPPSPPPSTSSARPCSPPLELKYKVYWRNVASLTQPITPTPGRDDCEASRHVMSTNPPRPLSLLNPGRSLSSAKGTQNAFGPIPTLARLDSILWTRLEPRIHGPPQRAIIPSKTTKKSLLESSDIKTSSLTQVQMKISSTGL
jgi:hypothetical protein